MKTILLFIVLSVPFLSRAQDCNKNQILNEVMLIPNKQDTFAYYQMITRHPGKQMPDMGYWAVPYMRKLLDTSLLFRESRINVHPSMMSALNASPLVIEGEIKQVIEADTSATAKNAYYTRTYIIQVKNVIKSKYKIAPGERILVKSYMSGYRRHAKLKKVIFHDFHLAGFYDMNKSYLFVLDRYEYMENMFKIKAGDSTMKDYGDIYCPTAFSLSTSTVGFSKQYVKGIFTTDELKKHLNSK